jgi:DNA (cytosine-5)-methyltransferase 1
VFLNLFAGPGGVCVGARRAGYTGPLAGIEWDQDACHTAVKAGHWRIRADVAQYPTSPFVGKTDGLWASPPCPTFSAAGNGAGRLDMDKVHDRIRAFANGRLPELVEWEDERSALTAEPMRWAYALRPRWIACEQVPAVLPLWQHIAMLLRGLGYKTWTGVVSAEEYGVAQTRKRSILIARRDGLPATPPAPTHQPYRPGVAPKLEDSLFGSALPAPVSMADALGLADPKVILRSNYSPTPSKRLTPDARGERMPYEPASTLTGRPPSWAPANSPKDAVRITVEEAGVLQSFPADYPWQGGKISQYLQVGNAVPPLLAAAIIRPFLVDNAAEEAA